MIGYLYWLYLLAIVVISLGFFKEYTKHPKRYFNLFYSIFMGWFGITVYMGALAGIQFEVPHIYFLFLLYGLPWIVFFLYEIRLYQTSKDDIDKTL